MLVLREKRSEIDDPATDGVLIASRQPASIGGETHSAVNTPTLRSRSRKEFGALTLEPHRA